MSAIIKKELPLIIATVFIAIIFIQYYIINDPLSTLVTIMLNWAVIITTISVGVGIISLLINNINNIKRKKSYWYLDIWMFVVFGIMVVTGFMGKTYGAHPSFQWMMTNIYVPLDGSVFALVLFDLVAAFYRTFRVKTIDSTILLASAFIIMIYQAPITGGMFPQFMPIGSWLLKVPTSASSRAIIIITAIGTIGFALRMMLRHERPTLGVVD